MGNCCTSETPGTESERLTSLSKKKDEKDASMMGKGVPKNRKKTYAKNTPLKLGYWKMRGLAQPIRYLLEYTEHPYEEDVYEQGNAPDYSVKEWSSKKNQMGLDFPALPYFIDNNDGIELKLTDTYAIM